MLSLLWLTRGDEYLFSELDFPFFLSSLGLILPLPAVRTNFNLNLYLYFLNISIIPIIRVYVTV